MPSGSDRFRRHCSEDVLHRFLTSQETVGIVAFEKGGISLHGAECRLRSNLRGAHLAKMQPVTISSPNLEIGSLEMDDIFTELFADPMVEIIPPERDNRFAGEEPSCLCCGRRAEMDEDCCGICEECLLS
jgi:hypothetical protein